MYPFDSPITTIPRHILKLLLSRRDVNANAIDKTGRSILHIVAAADGADATSCVQVAQLLISTGTLNINATITEHYETTDADGNKIARTCVISAFLMALANSKLELALLLALKGAHFTGNDRRGRNVFHLLVRAASTNPLIAKRLLKIVSDDPRIDEKRFHLCVDDTGSSAAFYALEQIVACSSAKFSCGDRVTTVSSKQTKREHAAGGDFVEPKNAKRYMISYIVQATLIEHDRPSIQYHVVDKLHRDYVFHEDELRVLRHTSRPYPSVNFSFAFRFLDRFLRVVRGVELAYHGCKNMNVLLSNQTDMDMLSLAINPTPPPSSGDEVDVDSQPHPPRSLLHVLSLCENPNVFADLFQKFEEALEQRSHIETMATQRDHLGFTALELLCRQPHRSPDSVQLLLQWLPSEKPAPSLANSSTTASPPDAVTQSGGGDVAAAERSDHVQCVGDKMKAGWDETLISRDTPLISEIQCHAEPSLVVIDALLAQGANLCEIVSTTGFTALHICVKKSLFSLAKALIERGAPINALDKQKESCLHLAIRVGDVEMVKVLLQHPHIDLNVQNRLGRTALHLAVDQSVHHDHSLDVLCLLLDAGAVPDVRDHYGRLPLHYAFIPIHRCDEHDFMFPYDVVDGNHGADKGFHDPIICVSLLCSVSKDVSSVDRYGRTPLHFACRVGALASAQAVIGHTQTDVDGDGDGSKQNSKLFNAVDMDGNSPLAVAMLSRKLSLSSYLLQQHDVTVNTLVHHVHRTSRPSADSALSGDGNDNCRDPDSMQLDDHSMDISVNKEMAKSAMNTDTPTHTRSSLVDEALAASWTGLAVVIVGKGYPLLNAIADALKAAEFELIRMFLRLVSLQLDKTLNASGENLLHRLAQCEGISPSPPPHTHTHTFRCYRTHYNCV